ncbi:MAG: glycosyltransferase family 9 protein [Acidobacteria bacterium]|jgi:ADP-heptose:LPS heptosyltransferase|nr:glycosyltransferase family 9 protein [Acidobacteriota bacterium]
MRFESLSWLDDRICGPACRLLASGRRAPEKNAPASPPDHVLLVKLRGIGDIILAMPMMQALKESGTRITFVTGPANRDWLARQKCIDDLLVVDFQRVWRSPRIFSLLRRIRNLQVDACIDLTQSAHFSAILGYVSPAAMRIGFENRNRRKRNKNRMYTHLVPFSGSEHMAACFFDLLQPFGIRRPQPLRLQPPAYSSADIDAVSAFLRGAGCATAPLVGIHASGAIPAKRWPFSGWAEICGDLIHRGYAVIAVGGDGEQEAVASIAAAIGSRSPRFVNAAGRLTMMQLFALMPRLKFFVANDGGPMHVAAAAGLPTLGLFGPEVPRRYSPLNDSSLALYKGGDLACSPCSKPYEGSWPTCRRPLCLSAITPADVRRAIGDLEQRSAAPAGAGH